MGKEPTMSTPENLKASLERIVAMAKARAENEVGGRTYATPSCVRCKATGWVEMTGGDYDAGYQDRRVMVTATPEKPVMKRCGCVPRAKPAAERPRGY